MASQDQFFQSDGVPIRYQVLGTGTPVILVHGYTADFESNWSGVVDLLTPHFQVIGMDARGHGKSGKPRDTDAYGVQMVRDVANLMDHLGIAKAHVAGYSMGGIIALKMASAYPDRLHSAVIAGIGMITPEDHATIGAMHEAAMRKAIEQQISVVDAMLPPDMEIPPSMATMVNKLRSVDNDPHALIAAIKAMDLMAISEGEAVAIRVPLLALYGSLDDQLKTVDRLKAAHPATEVIVLEGENHGSAPYAPAFAERLRDFLLRVGN